MISTDEFPQLIRAASSARRRSALGGTLRQRQLDIKWSAARGVLSPRRGEVQSLGAWPTNPRRPAQLGASVWFCYATLMPKRRLLLLAALTLAVIAAPVAWELRDHPGVTKANFDRIQKGMTPAEVSQLLGGPPGDVLIHTCWWSNDDGSEVVIHFSQHAVRNKTWNPSAETIADKFRRWLHLPK